MQQYELYHYGVKGMRWGIRRTPEERLKRYINREIDKVKTRRLGESKFEERRIRKSQKKYDQIKESNKNSQKVDRAINNLIRAKADAYASSAIAKREIDKLTSMKYEDMNAEKKAIGKSIIKSSLVTSAPMADIIKTDYRVDSDTYTKLINESYRKATDEVRGR